jgi:hypothetical protein
MVLAMVTNQQIGESRHYWKIMFEQLAHLCHRLSGHLAGLNGAIADFWMTQGGSPTDETLKSFKLNRFRRTAGVAPGDDLSACTVLAASTGGG